MSAEQRLKNLFDLLGSNTDADADIFEEKMQELNAQLDRELIPLSQSSSTPSQNMQPNESNALSSLPMRNQEFVILDHPPGEILQLPANDEIFAPTAKDKSVAELVKTNALLKELLIQHTKEVQNLCDVLMVNKKLSASNEALISAKEEKIVGLVKEMRQRKRGQSKKMLLKTLLTFAEKLKQNGMLSGYYTNMLSTWKKDLGENEDGNQNSFDIEEEELSPAVEDAINEPPEDVEQHVTSEVQMKVISCDENQVEIPEAAPILIVKTKKDFTNLSVSENAGEDIKVLPNLHDGAVAIEKESKSLDINSVHTEEQEIASGHSLKDQDEDCADQEGDMQIEIEEVESAEKAEEGVNKEVLLLEGSSLVNSRNDSEIVYARSKDDNDDSIDKSATKDDEVNEGNLADIGDKVENFELVMDEEATVGELQSQAIADEDVLVEGQKENTPFKGSKVDIPQVEAPVENLVKEAATKDLIFNEAPVNDFEKVQDQEMETNAEQQQLEMQADSDQMNADGNSGKSSEEPEKMQVDKEILKLGEGDKTQLAVATEEENKNLQGKPVDVSAEWVSEIALETTITVGYQPPEQNTEVVTRVLRSASKASQKLLQKVDVVEQDANIMANVEKPPTKKTRSYGLKNERAPSSRQMKKKSAAEKVVDEVHTEVVAVPKSKVRNVKNITLKKGEPERLEEKMSVEDHAPEEKKRKHPAGYFVMSPKKRRIVDCPLVKRLKKNQKKLQSVPLGKALSLGIWTFSSKSVMRSRNKPQNHTVRILAVPIDPETDTWNAKQVFQLDEFVEVCQEDKQEEDAADDYATMRKELFGSDCSDPESEENVPVVKSPKEKTQRRQGKKAIKVQQLNANMSKANPLLQKKRNK